MHCHKILVVEDDTAIRETIIELLSFEGYKAVPARNGREAIGLLSGRREDPCLILTDLIMPEMDGWEFIKAIKEQDIVITIPIVVMTAGKTDLIDGKIIKKPFNLDSLVRTVKDHCGAPDGGPILNSQTHL